MIRDYCRMLYHIHLFVYIREYHLMTKRVNVATKGQDYMYRNFIQIMKLKLQVFN